jgi:PIN domain nuclease of toxin-antitoxin system
MKYLLDTHAFLWWVFDDAQLPDRVRLLVADPAHRIFVSSASAWEITTKYRLGKLPSAGAVAQDVADAVGQAGFAELPISMAHAQRAGSWPQKHRDPFDRVLAAQSALEDLPFVTSDKAFRDFGIRCVW